MMLYVLEIVIFKLAKLNNQRMTANNEPTQMAKLSRDSTKKGDWPIESNRYAGGHGVGLPENSAFCIYIYPQIWWVIMFRIKIANWGKKTWCTPHIFRHTQIEIAVVKQKLIFQISLGRDDPGDQAILLADVSRSAGTPARATETWRMAAGQRLLPGGCSEKCLEVCLTVLSCCSTFHHFLSSCKHPLVWFWSWCMGSDWQDANLRVSLGFPSDVQLPKQYYNVVPPGHRVVNHFHTHKSQINLCQLATLAAMFQTALSPGTKNDTFRHLSL